MQIFLPKSKPWLRFSRPAKPRINCCSFRMHTAHLHLFTYSFQQLLLPKLRYPTKRQLSRNRHKKLRPGICGNKIHPLIYIQPIFKGVPGPLSRVILLPSLSVSFSPRPFSLSGRLYLESLLLINVGPVSERCQVRFAIRHRQESPPVCKYTGQEGMLGAIRFVCGMQMFLLSCISNLLSLIPRPVKC